MKSLACTSVDNPPEQDAPGPDDCGPRELLQPDLCIQSPGKQDQQLSHALTETSGPRPSLDATPSSW